MNSSYKKHLTVLTLGLLAGTLLGLGLIALLDNHKNRLYPSYGKIDKENYLYQNDGQYGSRGRF